MLNFNTNQNNISPMNKTKRVEIIQGVTLTVSSDCPEEIISQLRYFANNLSESSKNTAWVDPEVVKGVGTSVLSKRFHRN